MIFTTKTLKARKNPFGSQYEFTKERSGSTEKTLLVNIETQHGIVVVRQWRIAHNTPYYGLTFQFIYGGKRFYQRAEDIDRWYTKRYLQTLAVKFVEECVAGFEDLAGWCDDRATEADSLCDKWSGSDITFGDTGRSADDVEYGRYLAFLEMKERVGQ